LPDDSTGERKPEGNEHDQLLSCLINPAADDSGLTAPGLVISGNPVKSRF
jgi:hypothetical protein